ncbi:MAG: T9SS type A sorting domain-containing protein [Bacteroidetes bacterium]|nr:T9SS type A sorting domain-containing protein [Bacteroidota bacterium]
MKKHSLLALSFICSLAWGQNINMSNGTTNTCNANFYDSGGPGSNYGNNENLSHTFYPATPGTAIEIAFTSYVSGPADQISIYDGPDNTYPLLFNGGGNLTIPTFTSSDITGAITVEFNSNASGNQAGWVATISCCSAPLFWFEDLDGDGFGNMFSAPVYACTAPVGYVDNADDCDDAATLYEDMDGDGFGGTTTVGCGAYNNADCDDNLLTYQDNDGDTYGDPNTLVACGVTDNTDCDDNDAGVGTGTMYTWYQDNDGDGFGIFWMTQDACTQPAGYVSNADDCDDFSITYADVDADGFGDPAVTDPCGVYDNSDCDDNLVTYADNDGDTFGDPNIFDPCGVADNTDCDDTDAGIGGGTITVYYADNDGDGFGDMSNTLAACTPPAGYVANDLDCDDWSITYADNDGDGFGDPAVTDPCGVYDNSDCDDNLLTYADNDGDNFGDPNMPAPCGITDNTDCDDNDAGIGSGTINTYYPDSDGDGFGAPWWPVYACSQPVGFVTDSSDCDDWSVTYEDLDGDGYGNSAVQVPCGVYDGSDCNDNQLTYADNDSDTFGDPNATAPCGVTNNTDCDDTDAGIGAGSLVAYFMDTDGDGYGQPGFMWWSCTPIPGMVTDSTDCNDFDNAVNPGETEVAGNGIDDNCDGYIDPVAGIETAADFDFNLYPNPARTLVNIQWATALTTDSRIECIGMNGQILFTQVVASGTSQSELMLDSFEPGIYFVRLLNAESTATKILIVE